MIKREYDVNTGICHYSYKGIRFDAADELITDCLEIHNIDMVKALQRSIDVALTGYHIESIVDLKNKTAKLIITKRNNNDNG